MTTTRHYSSFRILATFAALLVAINSDAQTYSATSLHPSNATSSFAYGTQGTNFVGQSNGRSTLWQGQNQTPSYLTAGRGVAYANYGGQQVGQSAIWTGTAASQVPLYNGFDGTDIGLYGVSRGVQVGWRHRDGNGYAVSLRSTYASQKNISPSGFATSIARDTDGTQHVGDGRRSGAGSNVEAIWWRTDSSSNATSLQTSDLTYSYAYGLDGNLVGGKALGEATDYAEHAMLWNTSTSTKTDLNPGFLIGSAVAGVSSFGQVGTGVDSQGRERAIFWRGTAASAFDLTSVLSSDYVQARAYALTNEGVIAGAAFSTSQNRWEAYAWNVQPVPEPASLAALGLGALALLRRRGSRGRSA